MKCPDCGKAMVREPREDRVGSATFTVTAWWCTCGQSVHDGAALQAAERAVLSAEEGNNLLRELDAPHMIAPKSFIVCGEKNDEGVPMLCNACALREWSRERVSVSRDVLGGQPVIRNTRLAVTVIAGQLARGVPEAELLADYPYLTADDLKYAPRFLTATAVAESQLLADIAEGVASIERGDRTYTTAEVRERLTARRAARVLAAAATPGPWRVEGDQFDCPIVVGPNGERIADCDGSGGRAQSAANACLIVALRALIEDKP